MSSIDKKSRGLQLIESSNDINSSGDGHCVNHPHGAVDSKVDHKNTASKLDPYVRALFQKSKQSWYIRASVAQRIGSPVVIHDFYGYLSKEDAEKECPVLQYAIQTDHLWASHWQYSNWSYKGIRGWIEKSHYLFDNSGAKQQSIAKQRMIASVSLSDCCRIETRRILWKLV